MECCSIFGMTNCPAHASCTLKSGVHHLKMSRKYFASVSPKPKANFHYIFQLHMDDIPHFKRDGFQRICRGNAESYKHHFASERPFVP